MIEAYITNLGKYVEGDLCGEYLKLPASQEDVQALLSRIGVDGVLYEEVFITDYKMGVASLHGCLDEYESIDELNYLASLLDDMDEGDIEKFEAAIAYGEHANGVAELINLAQNLDCYEHYPEVTTEEELGYYLIDELGALSIPEHLVNYFDYEAYGRDAHLNGGTLTDAGYVEHNGSSFTEYYGGVDDIPDEYKIFAYPDPPEKMPIKQQLEMYGRMALSHAAADRPAPERVER